MHYTEESIRILSKNLRALQSILRLKILAALSTDPITVSDLAQQLWVSQPLLSWHLGELRRAGLVDADRVGREVYYHLQQDTIRALILELAEMLELDLCRAEPQTITEESNHG